MGDVIAPDIFSQHAAFVGGARVSITRSENMRRIRSRDTTPELTLRAALHRSGLRYRLHDSDLIGSPDIVFRTKKVAIFVHGCFWHTHPSCPRATIPATNCAYWSTKLERNRLRDLRVQSELRAQGWQLLVAWECEIRRDCNSVVRRARELLRRE